VGFNNGSIAWLERGVDFKYREYEFDSEFFNYVMDIVADFWTNNVQKDIPPEPINVEDLNRMYKRHREGDFIQATDEIKVTCDLLKSINEQLKELEQKKEDYINSLKMVMRDAEGIVLGQIPLVTWKTSKPSLIFDKDRFKLENPELYSNYLIEKEGTRRFLIK
jgi:predicted phage-related endonuclease